MESGGKFTQFSLTKKLPREVTFFRFLRVAVFIFVICFSVTIVLLVQAAMNPLRSSYCLDQDDEVTELVTSESLGSLEGNRISELDRPSDEDAILVSRRVRSAGWSC